jgi:excisionase family DNA binding protein
VITAKGANVVLLEKDWWKSAREPAQKLVVRKKSKLSTEYFTPRQIADRFQVGLDRIYDAIKFGELEAIVFGRQYRISREALEEYFEACDARKKRLG